MKNIKNIIIIIFLSLLLVGCKKENYQTFKEKHLDVQTAFKQSDEEYYLYFYSENCPYCDKIEKIVFKQAKNKAQPLYFINNEDVAGVLNRTSNIDYDNRGARSFLELKIYGFPTMLLIKNGGVISQFVGSNAITKELS